LINYDIDERTRPTQLAPSEEIWPQLIFSVDDLLLTSFQFENRLHRQQQKTFVIPNSSFKLMTMPRHSLKGQSFEIPGLMNFDNWNQNEMQRICEMKPNDSSFTSWELMSRTIRAKSSTKCANLIANSPLTDYSHETIAQTSVDEHKPPKEMFIDAALSKNKSLRILDAAVKSVGKNSKNVLKGDVVENPENAEEAAGVISLMKIRKNITKMENLPKNRILNSLEMISNYLRQSITSKKQILDDYLQDQTSPITKSD
jgi:hypothetical protein